MQISSNYIHPPSESISSRSPLELLANACNKLESDMLSSKSSQFLSDSRRVHHTPPPNTPPLSSPKFSLATSSPYTAASVYTSPHLSVRTAPVRGSTEASTAPIRGSTEASAAPIRGSTEASAAPKEAPRASPVQRVHAEPFSARSDMIKSESAPRSEPLSLVSKPKMSPAPSSCSPVPPSSCSPLTKSQSLPKRTEPMGTIKVKSAESLSPNPGSQNRSPPLNPSPRLAHSFPPTSLPPTTLAYSLSGLYTSSMLGLPGYQGLSSYPYLGLGQSPPCTDPLCRDPSCPTYSLRVAQAQLLGSGPSMHPSFPLGYPYPGLSLGLPGGGYPMMPPGFPGLHPALGAYSPYLSGLSGFAPPTTQAQGGSVGGGSPFMCSWMQGRDFCGRRFNSSEELMAHLRSHTSSLGEGPPSPVGPPPPSALALLQAQAAQLRGQSSPRSTPSLSPPASESRYHPYARPPLPSPHQVPPHLSSALPPHLPSPLHPLYGSPRPILPVLP